MTEMWISEKQSLKWSHQWRWEERDTKRRASYTSGYSILVLNSANSNNTTWLYSICEIPCGVGIDQQEQRVSKYAIYIPSKHISKVIIVRSLSLAKRSYNTWAAMWGIFIEVWWWFHGWSDKHRLSLPLRISSLYETLLDSNLPRSLTPGTPTTNKLSKVYL